MRDVLDVVPSPPPIEAHSSIQALNQQYIEAARTHDLGWFRTHMSDDAVVIFGSGQRVDKAGFLALMRDEPKDYEALTVRDVTVRVFGTVVQVDAAAPWTLRGGASGVSRYIDTYAWIHSRWQVISAQITWLPPT